MGQNGFTEAQLRYAFSMLDVNHDGKVNADELKSMASRLGIPISDQLVDHLMSKAAANGKVTKTFHSFL